LRVKLAAEIGVRFCHESVFERRFSLLDSMSRKTFPPSSLPHW
jgi:hypothetical protein